MPSGTSDGWLEAANEITKMIISNRCNAVSGAPHFFYHFNSSLLVV